MRRDKFGERNCCRKEMTREGERERKREGFDHQNSSEVKSLRPAEFTSRLKLNYLGSYIT